MRLISLCSENSAPSFRRGISLSADYQEEQLNAVDRCGEQFIEIGRYGERLTGCIECNRWSSNRSAFVVELSIEDIDALRQARSIR
jgi:hypothetical protein